MGLEGEGYNFMYNPLLDIETESDQPAPSSWLPQPPHITHMQTTCTPRTPWLPHAACTSLTAHTQPPHHHHAPHSSPTASTSTTNNPYAVHMHPMATTIHLQLNHPTPLCSHPQPHTHPHNFTSTMHPWPFTKLTQLTHAATPHHNSLTHPTQLTHAARSSPMHTSPSYASPHAACTPHSSPMASTAHLKPPYAAHILPQLTYGLLITTMHPQPPLRPLYKLYLAIDFFLWRIMKFMVDYYSKSAIL